MIGIKEQHLCINFCVKFGKTTTETSGKLHLEVKTF